MARTKKIKFLKSEIHLLLHPPTEGTWYCSNHLNKEGAKYNIANAGSAKKCWACQVNKPARPKKPWKDYVLACSKMGIEPGTPGTVVSKLMKRREEDARRAT